MTEDEKPNPQETGATTDRRLTHRYASQTESKAEPDTGSETAAEQKQSRKQSRPFRLKTALPRPMTNYCARSPNWKTRGDAPIATAPRPSNRGRSFARDMLGLPIIYSVRSTPWQSLIRTPCPMPQNLCSKVLPRLNAT